MKERAQGPTLTGAMCPYLSHTQTLHVLVRVGHLWFSLTRSRHFLSKNGSLFMCIVCPCAFICIVCI